MKTIIAILICVTAVLAHGGHDHGPGSHGHTFRPPTPRFRPRPTLQAFSRVDGPEECQEGTVFDLDTCTCFRENRCGINCRNGREANPFSRCGCMSADRYLELVEHDHQCSADQEPESEPVVVAQPVAQTVAQPVAQPVA